jgi:hypothetical protein
LCPYWVIAQDKFVDKPGWLRQQSGQVRMKLGGVDSLRGADIFFGPKTNPNLSLEQFVISWEKAAVA